MMLLAMTLVFGIIAGASITVYLGYRAYNIDPNATQHLFEEHKLKCTSCGRPPFIPNDKTSRMDAPNGHV